MCVHVQIDTHVQVDALKQKHVLLFVAEALTGSLETQRKMRQVRALRGKLRDGTIRGRRARQAAISELENLKKELNISSDEEITSKIESRESVSGNDDDDDSRRLYDSKDERSQESPRFSTGGLEEVRLRQTEGSSVDDVDDSGVLSGADTEPRLDGEAAMIESPMTVTNQNEAVTAHGVELSSSGDDDKCLSNSETPQSSQNEGMRGEPSKSDGTMSPSDSLCEDETRIGGELYIHTHTHTHTLTLTRTLTQSISSLYY